jgi:hypothetical protein
VLGLAGLDEQLRAQLRLQEFVGVALVDQDVAGPALISRLGIVSHILFDPDKR